MGSHQGSVLGCLLYCVTTERLTWKLSAGPDTVDRNERHRYFPQTSSDEEDVQFWPPSPWGRGPVHGQCKTQPGSFLYVDDTTLFDKVPLSEGTMHITTDAPRQMLENLAFEGDFVRLAVRAEDIGMRINNKKTHLLAIGPQNGCVTSAAIDPGDGQMIRSLDRMKLIGFTFGDTPGAAPHVESIEEQYKRKKWMLYDLRDAGLRGKQLYRLYCCYVRLSFEYCSPVYHAILNKGQEERLEKLQRHALRVCFGSAIPVEEVMEQNARRERRRDAFVVKAWRNPRFREAWFPERNEVPWSMRNRRVVQEVWASTNRRQNSPLAFMKRRLNELGLGVTQRADRVCDNTDEANG